VSGGQVGADGGTPGRWSLRLLQVTAFVSTVDRFAMPPMLLLIARDLGVPLSVVVRAAGAYYLTYGLMQPVWAAVSDRYGLVGTMRVALLLGGAASTASALCWGSGPLVVTRALAGACFSAAIPGTLVYVGDTVPSAYRQRDVTDLMAGVALGTTAATAGAGLVAERLGWRWMFTLIGVATVAVVTLLAWLPETARTRRDLGPLEPLRAVARSGPARLVVGLAFAEGAVLLGVLTFLPPAVAAGGTGASVAGLVTAAYGLSVLAASRVVRVAAPRTTPVVLVAVGAACVLAGCALAAVRITPLGAVGACVLLGAAWASMHTTLQTWATQVVPAARAAAVALFAAGLFAGSAAGSVLVGGLAEHGSYSLIFEFGAVAAVPLGFVAAAGLARFHDPESPGPAPR
jgi:predicted MFS family arabinose efflux permease